LNSSKDLIILYKEQFIEFNVIFLMFLYCKREEILYNEQQMIHSKERFYVIGERIKEIRLRKHYSITRLAEEAQISKSYLSQIEKGANTNPSLQMLYKIAASLGTTIDYLIDEKTDGVTNKESAPYITEEWLSLLNQAIRQGMTKEDFLEFHNYLQFKKNLQTWKDSRF